MLNLTKNRNLLLLCKNVTKKCKRFKSDDVTGVYCLDTVKKHDYENFLCTLLLKNRARTTAFAVRSFNVEVSKAAEHVSQPTIGLMRMKFWEDLVDQCFSGDFQQVPRHPIAIELYKAITASNLTKRYFRNLINSRTELFTNPTFNDIEDMENYSEKSVSSVYYLILEGCGVRSVIADHAASHLGKAQGLVQQLRSTHLTKQLKCIPLPQHLLTKHDISHEELIRGKPSEKLCECCFEIAYQAFRHLKKSRDLMGTIPEEGRAALLPAIAVEAYLNKLENVNYDVMNPELHKRTWGWVPKLWFNNFFNKY